MEKSVRKSRVKRKDGDLEPEASQKKCETLVNKDRLCTLVRESIKHQILPALSSTLAPKEQLREEVVFHAVSSYMAELMAEGFIPYTFLDALEIDLKEEARIIYRKITYGQPHC